MPMKMSRDNNVVEAVRDAVQVRSTDQSSRTRMARSNTEAPVYVAEPLSSDFDTHSSTSPILPIVLSLHSPARRARRLVLLAARTRKILGYKP